MVNILDKGIKAQQAVQEKGGDILSDKFFRGVKSNVRQAINQNFLKPNEIDMSKIKDKLSKAMTIAFLVSSGKVDRPQIQESESPVEFAETGVEKIISGNSAFNFDLPFGQAVDLWGKANPQESALLENVLFGTENIAGNSINIMNTLLGQGVDDILRTGEPISKMVSNMSEVVDKGTSFFETALRTGVATAQNAGHQMRMLSTPGIALWEFRAIRDDRTTGAPGGIYSGTANKNPGYDFQLHKFVAPPNHSVWQSIYPPNHFNCRCKVVAISWTRAAELGYTKKGKRELKEKYKNPKIPSFVASGEWPAEGFDRSPMSYLGVA
jgi:hypothetical protein